MYEHEDDTECVIVHFRLFNYFTNFLENVEIDDIVDMIMRVQIRLILITFDTALNT